MGCLHSPCDSAALAVLSGGGAVSSLTVLRTIHCTGPAERGHATLALTTLVDVPAPQTTRAHALLCGPGLTIQLHNTTAVARCTSVNDYRLRSTHVVAQCAGAGRGSLIGRVSRSRAAVWSFPWIFPYCAPCCGSAAPAAAWRRRCVARAAGCTWRVFVFIR